MFASLTLTGVRGSIVWAYHDAATIAQWVVRRSRDEQTQQWRWRLAATLGPSVDRFKLRQRPLRFVAPRHGGFWCWQLRELTLTERTLVATLDPPEY